MPFALKVVTPPASEPVSLEIAKSQLNLDPSFTADDDLVSAMISAARRDAENFTGRAFAMQQWLFCLDWFPAYRILDSAPSRSDYDSLGNYYFQSWRWNKSQSINIPRPPLVSIDSLQYVDQGSGQLTTLDPSQYQVDNISEPGRILPADSGYWPVAATVVNAVQIRFTAGYDTVPPTAIQAILLTVGAWYANREDFLLGVAGATTLPMGAQRLLSMERTEIFGYSGR